MPPPLADKLSSYHLAHMAWVENGRSAASRGLRRLPAGQQMCSQCVRRVMRTLPGHAASGVATVFFAHHRAAISGVWLGSSGHCAARSGQQAYSEEDVVRADAESALPYVQSGLKISLGQGGADLRPMMWMFIAILGLSSSPEL